MSKTIRVLLANDHPALRLGLRVLLEQARKLARDFCAHFDKAYGDKNIDPAVARQCPGKQSPGEEGVMLIPMSH